MPVDTVLARLRERPFDIQEALQGAVLTMEVIVTAGGSKRCSVVFSPDGHLSVFASGDEVPAGFTPQVRLRGTAEQVLGVVLGETDAFTAVFHDVLELSVTPAELTPHFPRLMKLVREEVWALLEADRPAP